MYKRQSYGYVLLGAAIEAASGKSFEENLLHRILLPIGMTRTGLEHTGRMDADSVRGFRLRAGKVVPADRIDISSRFSSGGMRSTASDLLLYARALMEATIVDEKIWLSMIEPVVTTDGRRADYGLSLIHIFADDR